jgi:hypothetical protein
MCDRCIEDRLAGTNSHPRDTEEVSSYYGNGMKAQSATDSYLKSDVGMQMRSPQYTPLLVQMMIEMYVNPDMRAYYLYGSPPSAQREILELLKRAKIIVPKEAAVAYGASPLWNVDEDALRVYVNAICSVSLPENRWEIRS